MKTPRAALAAVATQDGKIFAIGGTDVSAYRTVGKSGQGRAQETVEILDVISLTQ